ncbi:MAG: RHS repeat-associated core domain-containing protein [Microbacterium sp.]
MTGTWSRSVPRTGTRSGPTCWFVRTDTAQREYLSDALGSTIALADATGVVQTSYTYEPFGRTTVSGASSTSAYQFTGRDNDSTGGLSLYNLRNRFYSPTLGRFLTQDPIGFAGGEANLYACVQNRPTTATDPTGLWCLIHNSSGGCLGGSIVHGAVDAARFVKNLPFTAAGLRLGRH